MRRNEIDWIRNIGVLLLFVFHTASIFTYYEPWYIWSDSKSWLATIIFILCIPWHMPVLFFLAGASTRFSLGSRSGKKYILGKSEKTSNSIYTWNANFSSTSRVFCTCK